MGAYTVRVERVRACLCALLTPHVAASWPLDLHVDVEATSVDNLHNIPSKTRDRLMWCCICDSCNKCTCVYVFVSACACVQACVFEYVCAYVNVIACTMSVRAGVYMPSVREYASRECMFGSVRVRVWCAFVCGRG